MKQMILIMLILLVTVSGAMADSLSDMDGFAKVWRNDSDVLAKRHEMYAQSRTMQLMYCQGMQEKAVIDYGGIESALNVELETNTTRKSSYTTMCLAIEGVIATATADDIRRIAIILADPLRALAEGQLGAKAPQTVLYVLGNMESIGLVTLISIDHDFYPIQRSRSARYKQFYSALLSGDNQKVLKIIRTVSKSEIDELNDFTRSYLHNRGFDL